MIHLTSDQSITLKSWFLPERAGSLVGSHVMLTGNGMCFVDRWPAPRAVLVETAGNYTLLGEAQAIAPEEIRPHIRGFVETSEAFVPLLKTAFPDIRVWQRVVFAQQEALRLAVASDLSVRRLGPSDIHHLLGLSPDAAWISKTWGGPQGLASSGFGWGVFMAGQLVSVACTFFLGETFEDIGVVTESGFRGKGLSTACAQALCDDIRARGHCPTWTTSPDNTASIRVAEKLGFTVQRNYELYVVGVQIPEPARPPQN